ncbi:hypothetical protein ACX1C1_19610 [Paenibacillus sp. strain BS8-2]
MKYFKPEIWLDLQTLDSMDEAEMEWKANARKYLTQLEDLKSKLSQRNYEFFRFFSLHDGYIVNLNIQNKNSQEMKDYNATYNLDSKKGVS